MNPFLRWVGSKRRLIPVLRPLLGKIDGDYCEPFMGGGAMFFHLAHNSEIGGHAYLNDVNIPLMTAFRGVAENHRRVESIIAHWADTQSFDYASGCAALATWPTLRSRPDAAALFIAMNQLSFNGLYRVNRAGKFNVPRGKNAKGDLNQLRSVHLASHSVALNSSVTLHSLPFEMISHLVPGSVIFADPPYLDQFSNYDGHAFDRSDHERLHIWCKDHAARGVRVLLCASDTQASREVYGDPLVGFGIDRMVGASNRKRVHEIFYLYGV